MANKPDLRVAKPIATGLAQLEAAGTGLANRWPAIRDRIRALSAAEPWGDGAEATSFLTNYLANGGPDGLLHETDRLVKQVGDLAPRMRTTIANTLNADAANEASLRKI
ncbi:hypothetical protein SAMN05421505_11092 [Sinosporangium album]|uniref:Excreted virulence factor EspC, type VII ESX diderm n=1 Tax=Sinosporangium album TaxID=504805 RepID=A0A1G7YWW0_9ACTN|nr:hypothetical protein [Sinosporangium album]SDH00835.1 hypothetical protein SAMN05421505_11092 [Sinosporangium album]